MKAQMALTVTLCYQFDSDYYDSVALNACVARAVEEVDRAVKDYNIVVYDPIEEGLRSGVIHDNIHQTIQKANVVIFDISDLNPNVLYELGMSRGLNKKLILLREEKSTGDLPFDIQPFLYLRYSSDKHKFETFHYTLAQKIKQAIEAVPKTELIPSDLLEEYLGKHFIPIQTTDDLTLHLREMINVSELNFYYIGSAGLLSLDEEWINTYSENLEKVQFCRIVFLRSLGELYDEHKDVRLLRNQCLWLSQCYGFVKSGVFTQFFTCPEVGGGKAGMCLFVADEKEVLITSGAFDDFNRKGVLIKHQKVGQIFKEYARTLAISNFSTRIDVEDFGKYFSISTTRTDVPEVIEQAINQSNVSVLEETCTEYIQNEIAELS